MRPHVFQFSGREVPTKTEVWRAAGTVQYSSCCWGCCSWTCSSASGSSGWPSCGGRGAGARFQLMELTAGRPAVTARHGISMARATRSTPCSQEPRHTDGRLPVPRPSKDRILLEHSQQALCTAFSFCPLWKHSLTDCTTYFPTLRKTVKQRSVVITRGEPAVAGPRAPGPRG